MFHPIDLIAPIGICLLTVFLCVLGFIRTQKYQAKIVCVLTALVFVSSIPFFYFMRWNSRKADYVTEQGVRVRQGKKNKCEKKYVTEQVQWVINWWQERYLTKDVAKALDDKLLVCVDAIKMSVLDRWVGGFAWGSMAVVGWDGNPEYTTSLIRHELSHFAAHACGHQMDEEEHHKLFKKLGLGH